MNIKEPKQKSFGPCDPRWKDEAMKASQLLTIPRDREQRVEKMKENDRAKMN